MSPVRVGTVFPFFLVCVWTFTNFTLAYTSPAAHYQTMNIRIGEDAYIQRHSPLIILSNITATMGTRDLSYAVCFERVIDGESSIAGCTQPGMTDQAIDMHQVTQINGFWGLHVSNFTSEKAVYWLVNGETHENVVYSTIRAIDCAIDNANIQIKGESSRLTYTSCPIQNFDKVANIVLKNNQDNVMVEYQRSRNGQFVKDDDYASPTSYAHLTLMDKGDNWFLQFKSCKSQESISVIFTRKDRSMIELNYVLHVSDFAPAITAKTDNDDVIHMWCNNGDRGFQDPTFFRNGAEIKSGDGLSIVNDTVVINGVTNTTEGYYTCQIQTACGKAESNPYTIPLQEGRCHCTEVERTPSITCAPPGYKNVTGTTQSYTDVFKEPTGMTQTIEAIEESADKSPMCEESLIIPLIVLTIISIILMPANIYCLCMRVRKSVCRKGHTSQANC